MKRSEGTSTNGRVLEESLSIAHMMFLCHYTVIYAHQNCYREISAVLEVDVRMKIKLNQDCYFCAQQKCWKIKQEQCGWCVLSTNHQMLELPSTAPLSLYCRDLNITHKLSSSSVCILFHAYSLISVMCPLLKSSSNLCSDIGKYVNNCIHNAASCQPVVV